MSLATAQQAFAPDPCVLPPVVAAPADARRGVLALELAMRHAGVRRVELR